VIFAEGDLRVGARIVRVFCRFLFSFLILAQTTWIAGCHSVGSISGRFSGNLSTFNFPGVKDRLRKPVLVQIEPEGSQGAKVLIKHSEKDQGLFPLIHITRLSSRGMDLHFEGLGAQPVHLNREKVKGMRCYVARASREIEACFDEYQFHFKLTGPNRQKIRLAGTRRATPRDTVYEAERDYTFAEAFAEMLKKNWDIREEREVLLRAKLAAKSAYLDLLPKISINSILSASAGMMAMDPWTITGTAGDLIPFFFPGRWIAAQARKWEAEAEKIADLLLKTNLGASLQTLAMSVASHRDVHRELLDLQSRLEAVCKILQALEQSGRLSKDTRVTLDLAEVDLAASILELEDQLQNEMYSLSLVLGKKNPHAVKQVFLDPSAPSLKEIPVLNPIELKKEQKKYAKMAVDASLELLQQEFLEKAARKNRAQVLTRWFDVDGGLSASIITDAKTANSNLRSVNIREDRVEADLVSQSFNLIHDRNQSMKFFFLAEKSLVDRRERLNTIVNPILEQRDSFNPSEFSAEDLRECVEDLVAGLNFYYNTRSAVQVNQAMLDRLVLAGSYELLVPSLKALESIR
jgi:hypothetical protein